MNFPTPPAYRVALAAFVATACSAAPPPPADRAAPLAPVAAPAANASPHSSPPSGPPAPPSDVAPFAVVELFTSEGCSSCPPADQNLNELVDDAERRARRVFALSFHVDYWNSLGWPDPFSTSAYTRRQEAYANLAGARGVYTPQMIINGADGFLGSDRARARRGVERALDARPPAAAPLTLRLAAARPRIAADLDAPGLPPGTLVNVALAERVRAQHVPRGENAGRTLRHRNVVRAFTTFSAREPGPWHVELPAAGLERAPLVVVAYAQDPASFVVLAADAASVPAAP